MTIDPQIFSDLYKSAYGFRPRGHEFDTASEARRQEIMAETQKAADEAFEAEQAEAEQAQVLFLQQVEKLMGDHDITREDAVRWLFQAEGSEDPESFAYDLGILFTELGRDVVALLSND